MKSGVLKSSHKEALDKLASLHKPTAIKEARSIRADLYASDLFVLARHGLGFKDVNYRTHGPMIEILESPSKKKMIVVPRGCLKSSIACVAYPIKKLLNNPNIRILLDSELYTNSKNFIREIRGHLQSEKFHGLYGDLLHSYTESEIIVKGRTQVLKEASLTASGVGTVKVGQHYDLIIFDDLNSQKNSANPEQRKKIIDHFKYMFSILEPGGTIVITATRYSEDDVIGFVLSNLLGLKEPKYGVILSDDTRPTVKKDSALYKYL